MSAGSRILALAQDERLRFLIVGGINTLVGYGTFALVQYLAGHVLSYFGSLLVAHLLASALAFVLYRRWVFRVAGGSTVLDFLRFQTVYLIPLGANAVALPLLVELANWSPYLAQAAIIMVSTVISYLGHKYFSFRRPQDVIEGGDAGPEDPSA